MSDNFGYTNDKTVYESVIKFKERAIIDGWQAAPTYENSEDISRAATLTKEGFTMMIITRTDTGKWKYQASVNIWGSDGLVIMPPKEYSFEEIKQALSTCTECGEKNCHVQRVGFAGRCCDNCLASAKKKHEYPGWTH